MNYHTEAAPLVAVFDEWALRSPTFGAATLTPRDLAHAQFCFLRCISRNFSTRFFSVNEIAKAGPPDVVFEDG